MAKFSHKVFLQHQENNYQNVEKGIWSDMLDNSVKIHE